MTIKILVDALIFESYPHGGIARIYREVLPRVADLQNEFDIRLAVRSAPEQVLPQHDHVATWGCRPWNYRPSRVFAKLNQWRYGQLQKRIEAWRPDIFHATYYTQSPVSGAKAVALVYDLIDDQFPLMMPNGPGFVERQGAVLRKADAVVAISDATRRAAVERFQLSPLVASTVHLDASPVFQPLPASAREEFRQRYVRGRHFFLFVGSTGSYKNLGVLIRGLGEVQEPRDQALVIAGHSVGQLDPYFIDLSVQGRVEERIVRLVHPSDEVLCQAYNAADAFVFPSLQEGFGIPLVEAMRCGTPVVASDIAVFHEVCGEAALFFDPHDHRALAKQLMVVKQPEVRERLVALGFERAKKFSWDRAAEQLAEIYLRLAGSPR